MQLYWFKVSRKCSQNPKVGYCVQVSAGRCRSGTGPKSGVKSDRLLVASYQPPRRIFPCWISTPPRKKRRRYCLKFDGTLCEPGLHPWGRLILGYEATHSGCHNEPGCRATVPEKGLLKCVWQRFTLFDSLSLDEASCDSMKVPGRLLLSFKVSCPILGLNAEPPPTANCPKWTAPSEDCFTREATTKDASEIIPGPLVRPQSRLPAI